MDNKTISRKIKKTKFCVELTGEEILFLKEAMEEADASLFNQYYAIEDVSGDPNFKKYKRQLYNKAHNFNDMKDYMETKILNPIRKSFGDKNG